MKTPRSGLDLAGIRFAPRDSNELQGPPLSSPAARPFLSPLGTAALLFVICQAVSPIVRIHEASPLTLDAVELFVRPARLWKYPKPIEFGALLAQVVCLL